MKEFFKMVGSILISVAVLLSGFGGLALAAYTISVVVNRLEAGAEKYSKEIEIMEEKRLAKDIEWCTSLGGDTKIDGSRRFVGCDIRRK
jgi:hypothetical protein